MNNEREQITIPWLEQTNPNALYRSMLLEFGDNPDFYTTWDFVTSSAGPDVAASIMKASVVYPGTTVTDRQKQELIDIDISGLIMERIINPFWLPKSTTGDIYFNSSIPHCPKVEMSYHKQRGVLQATLPIRRWASPAFHAKLTYNSRGKLICILSGMPEDRFNPNQVASYQEDYDDTSAIDQHMQLDVQHFPVVIEALPEGVNIYDNSDMYCDTTPSSHIPLDDCADKNYPLGDNFQFSLNMHESGQIDGFQFTRRNTNYSWKVGFPASLDEDSRKALIDPHSHAWVQQPLWSQFRVHYQNQ